MGKKGNSQREWKVAHSKLGLEQPALKLFLILQIWKK
jgi:hypothetical protein